MLCRNECVGSRLTRGKRTFGDTIGAVHWIGIELSQTMPVETRPVVGETIFHCDLKGVTPSSTNSWSRKLPINAVHDS